MCVVNEFEEEWIGEWVLEGCLQQEVVDIQGGVGCQSCECVWQVEVEDDLVLVIDFGF